MYCSFQVQNIPKVTQPIPWKYRWFTTRKNWGVWMQHWPRWIGTALPLYLHSSTWVEQYPFTIHHKTPQHHSHSLLSFQLELEQRISNPTMDIIANAIQNITQPNSEIRVFFIPPFFSCVKNCPRWNPFLSPHFFLIIWRDFIATTAVLLSHPALKMLW